MDRSAKKRKAAPVSASSPEGREAKRQKTPTSPVDPYYTPKTKETPETVLKIGRDFFSHMKRAKDKNGRLICTSFLTLPSKKEFPGYYRQTVMPLAIDALEAKLERGEYKMLTELESDVKRLVNNAKAFNNNKSDIFLDAERIRKMTSNYMVKHNPAYEDPKYSAFATPLPTDAATQEADAEAERDDSPAPQPAPIKLSLGSKAKGTPAGKPPPIKAAPTPAAAPPVKVESTPAATTDRRATRGANNTPQESLKRTLSAIAALDPDEEGYDPDFTGKTFQQAQRQLLNEMIKYKDDGDVVIFEPFINLPPRNLTEYYETIKQPTSLRSVMNKVIGFHGRAGSTGITELKSWAAFEQEMEKIWDNCRIYNQEDSEIYALANELEEYFKERLAEAKAKVEEPPQPSLKLNLAAKSEPKSAAAPIKLKLGVPAKASPSPAPPASITVTKPKLEPAKQAQLPSRPSPSPAPQARPVAGRTASALGKSPAMTPATISLKTSTPAAVPAPTPSIPTSTLPPVSSVTVGAPAHAQPYVPYMTKSTGLDSKWRPEGKSISDALITSLLITSHPSLGLPYPFQHTLPASPVLTHQSLTLTLPQTHSLLQFEPFLSPTLAGAQQTEKRQYKLFVLVNGQRVQANFLPGQARLQYDIRLGVGMNRVEVECVAGGFGASPGKVEELDGERISVFVGVLRA